MERRKSVRFRKVIPIQFEKGYGIVMDISRGGLKIFPDAEVSDMKKIRIHFPLVDGRLIQLHGVIVRMVDKKTGKERFELGIQIVSAPREFYDYMEMLEEEYFFKKFFNKGFSASIESEKPTDEDFIEEFFPDKSIFITNRGDLPAPL